MANIALELDEKYREQLDVLKQVVPDMEGKEITDDSKMVEALIESFMAFLQQQAAAHEHGKEGECCGGGGCGSH